MSFKNLVNAVNRYTELLKTLRDKMTRHLVSISSEHSHIHDGVSFERHIDSANLTVADLNVAFKTKAGTKKIHAIFGYGMSDEILFEVFEGATWTQGSGTSRNLFNHNRNKGNSELILEDKNQATFTASNQIIQDVTGVSGGNQFENQYSYNAGLGSKKVAETRSSAHEWVLKTDTQYLIRMTQTGGNCKMSIDLHFYELDDPTDI